MKRTKRILATVGCLGLFAATIVGCEMFNLTDPIIGEWQLVSENGVAPASMTEAQFTENRYTASTGTVETHAGTWTKSGDTYALTGTFVGFASSGSLTPTFSNAKNTLTYSNESDDVYVYNRR